MFFILALILGATAGLRSVMPLAAVSIGAALGWLGLGQTWAGFVGAPGTATILGVLAIGELVGDAFPKTPNRTRPLPFTARVVTGAFAGAVLGTPSNNWLAGLILGAIGGALGTLGGYEGRKSLAKAFGHDLPAALIEDLIAIILAFWAVYAVMPHLALAATAP